MENSQQILGLSDHSRTIRRHRANRQKRQGSPRAGAAMTSSTSSGGSHGDCLTSVRAGPGEDEDMANCLILLAQGDSPPGPIDHEHPQEGVKSENMIDSIDRRKRASELGVVYECKTCNRVFPSFQALGGHRASHSKPSKGQRDHDQDRSDQICETAILSPGLRATPDGGRPEKVHECSICGSQFTSGQALGGHMRRHRSLLNGDDEQIKKPRRFLPLDLNLPAPEEEDDEKDFMFGFGPGRAVPPPLLFSANALVGCHY